MRNIKHHAFAQSCDNCSVHQRMVKERTKLQEEITLLSKFAVPSPKAEAKLEQVSGRIRDCAFGRCQENGGE